MTAPASAGLETLLPCPFCGGTPQVIMEGSINQFISCTSCKCSTDDTGDSSVTAWNRRAPSLPVPPASAAEPTEAAITRDVTTGADKIIAMLRAREAETIAAIGHLMTKTEKPLEGIAADLIEQLLAAVGPAGPTEAQLHRVDAVLVAFCRTHGLADNSTWRLKHRVRKALEGGR